MTNGELISNLGALRKINNTDAIEDWQLALQLVDFSAEVDAHIKRYNKAYNVIQFKHAKTSEAEDREMKASEIEARETEVEELQQLELTFDTELPVLNEEIVKRLYKDKEIDFKIGDVKALSNLGIFKRTKSVVD